MGLLHQLHARKLRGLFLQARLLHLGIAIFVGLSGRRLVIVLSSGLLLILLIVLLVVLGVLVEIVGWVVHLLGVHGILLRWCLKR